MRTSAPATPSPARRRLRVLTLGAVTVAAVGAALLPTAAAGASPSAPVLPARSRAQIPWSSVGSGWTLATWSPSTNPNSKAKVSLYLVGGKGDRYLIARLSAGSYPVALSTTGQQALVSTDSGSIADISLRTGHAHNLAIRNLDSVLGFTDAGGRSLLVSVDAPAGDSEVTQLERVSLFGHRELTYPSTDKVVGSLNTFGGVQQTTDGKDVVVGGDHGLAVLRNSDGKVVRRLLTTKRDCSASSWWSKGVALASCNGVLFTVPVSGAKAHQISLASSQDPFGYQTAWQTGASTPRLGLAPNGCGPASLVRFDRNGHGIRITVPAPIKATGRTFYIGHHADSVTMIFNAFGGCGGGTDTLFSYNAATNHSTALLGTSVNGGTVVGDVPWPTDQ